MPFITAPNAATAKRGVQILRNIVKNVKTMAGKLIVKNFGPIRDVEMIIDKTTVLIGPQGSGKSTLVKLVAIMTDPDIYPNIKSRTQQLFEEYNLQNYIQKNSELLFENAQFKVKYAYNDLKITLNEGIQQYANEIIENNGIRGVSSFEVYKEMIQRRRESQDYSPSPSFMATQNFYTQFIEEYNLFKPSPVYLPSERQLISLLSNSLWSIINSGANLPKNVTTLGSFFERARNKIKKIQIPFLNLTYRYEENTDRIFFEDDKSILLSESAAGFQTILPLLLTLEYLALNDSTNFIIEEPELNLYPTTQKSLIYHINEKRGHFHNEILMTTHSPYVLAALNNLLFAHKVAKDHPEKATEVEKVIPRFSWLNPDEFAAYFVADGTVRSIINPKTGLISENELDNVSDEIGDEFDSLMDIYRSAKNETIH